mgnify:CR=1 FL=1
MSTVNDIVVSNTKIAILAAIVLWKNIFINANLVNLTLRTYFVMIINIY